MNSVRQPPASRQASARKAFTPPTVSLAVWRLKRMWVSHLIVLLGALALVGLVCAIPLLTEVTAAASFADKMINTPETDTLTVFYTTNTYSHQQQNDYQRRLTTAFQRIVPGYPIGAAQPAHLSSQSITVVSGIGRRPAIVSLQAFSAQVMGRELALVGGRMPDAASSNLEVLVPHDVATAQHVVVGAQLAIALDPSAPQQQVLARVVGIMSSSDAELQPRNQTVSGRAAQYQLITTTEAIDAMDARHFAWQQLAQAHAFEGPHGEQIPFWQVDWSHRLDFSTLSTQQVEAIVQSPSDRVMSELTAVFAQVTGSDDVFVYSPAFDAVTHFKQRLVGAQVISVLLVCVTMGLALVYLTLTTDTLVERQRNLIALLRSRGATRRQMTGFLSILCFVLVVVTGGLGPFVGVALAALTAYELLPTQRAGAITQITGDVLQAGLHVWPYAAVASLIILVTLVRAARRTASLDVLAARRMLAEDAQTHSYWQRYHLDVVSATLGFACYGVLLVTIHLVNERPPDVAASIRLALAPVALVAPVFLAIAVASATARLFPIFIQHVQRVVSRTVLAPVHLAFSQLGRAAPQAIAVITLFTFAISYLCFALAAEATIPLNVQLAARYRAGADFSGGLPISPGSAVTAATWSETYERIPGVLSAAVGYRVRVLLSGSAKSTGEGVQIAAVDAERFGTTALWPDNHQQPRVAALMQLLITHRRDASEGGSLAAIVDDVAWSSLHLSPGATFTLPASPTDTTPLRFVVVAHVATIPTMYAARQGSGGMIVDLASYSQAVQAQTGAQPVPNFIWLRTRDDAASLQAVRTALRQDDLRLRDLRLDGDVSLPVADRRALELALESDLLYVGIRGMVILGALAALVLAMIGGAVTIWRALSDQAPALAVLRGMGLSSQGLFGVLFCEQVVVTLVAAITGVLLGILLAMVTLPLLPDLVFSSSMGGMLDAGGPPPTVSIPWSSIAAVIGGLLLAASIGAGIAAQLVARGSASRLLLLSEN